MKLYIFSVNNIGVVLCYYCVKCQIYFHFFFNVFFLDFLLLYSVPYHPETNAIEEYFNQLKQYIKKESPNTYDDIFSTIKHIIATKITREHLTNYLKHSYKIYKS